MLGNCYRCNKKVDINDVPSHAQKCNELKDNECVIGVISEGVSGKLYWVGMICTTNTKLSHIETFLKDIWLYCCPHRSTFSYNKKATLMDVIKKTGKMERIMYEYDMGSTTSAVIQVLKHNEACVLNTAKKATITLVCQNRAPLMKCVDCKKKAVSVGENGGKCGVCADEEDLPLLNSPRTGVCGYDGENLPENVALFSRQY